MWVPENEPDRFRDGQGTDGYDGEWWKWWLHRGEETTFTVVKAPAHVLLRPPHLSERMIRAIDSEGRSEIERYLSDERPPRIIELRKEHVAPLMTVREWPDGPVSSSVVGVGEVGAPDRREVVEELDR